MIYKRECFQLSHVWRIATSHISGRLHACVEQQICDRVGMAHDKFVEEHTTPYTIIGDSAR
jgi:hypothetical protein